MSGIAVIVGEVDDIEFRLAAMLRKQEHRGGDNKGFWVSSFAESRLGLAYCGKVVSETEEEVHQPYVDEDMRVVALLDGDIYNSKELRNRLAAYYTFKTNSAVELLSKAYRFWGAQFVQHIEGAFVIVIYDRRNEKLLLARDRFGVKPLYYASHRGNFFFATEVRALFAAGILPRLSAEQWAGYLLYTSYGDPCSTFWRDVRQLPAGTTFTFNGYSMSECEWYSLYDDIAELVASYEEEELAAMLLAEMTAVAEHSIADVTMCGLRLSGRVESQLLLQLAIQGQHRWKIRTFVGDIEPVGTCCEALPITITARQALSELQRMTQWVEEPIDGCEWVVCAAMLRQARNEGVSVVCSGVGLDVLWQDEWNMTDIRYNYRTRHPLFTPGLAHCAVRPHYHQYFGQEVHDARYIELRYELLPHTLRFLNRAAAEAQLSMRMPFLSSRMVALSFALPIVSRELRHNLFSRYISHNNNYALHPAGANRIIEKWMQGDVREWVGDSLSDLCRSGIREWLDARYVQSLWKNISEGQYADLPLLWKCLSLYHHYNYS